MKKILTLSMSLIIVFLLIGCSNSTADNSHKKTSSESNLTSTTFDTKSSFENETTVNSEVQTTTPEEPNIDVKWTSFVNNFKDADGYTFEADYKLSPWVFHTNTEILNSLWNQVGTDAPVPTFKDWGLSLYPVKGVGNMYTREGLKGIGDTIYGHYMTDMYYCIGTVTFKNLTSGWDISKQNPRNILTSLVCICEFKHPDHITKDYNYGANYLTKIFFQNGSKDLANILFDFKMTENEVRVPFIIMAPENISPDYPDGEHYEYLKESYFKLDDNTYQIGIIGKDKEYVTS